MHSNNYRHKNPVGGFFIFMLTLLGALILVGFITGFLRHVIWPIPMVGTLLVILFVASIISSSRRRTRHRHAQRQQYRRYETYKPTENPFWKNQENQVVQEQEPVQRVVNSTKFCDYCGMKVKEEMSFCTNCGNRLK